MIKRHVLNSLPECQGGCVNQIQNFGPSNQLINVPNPLDVRCGCLYNILYGNYKILALTDLFLFIDRNWWKHHTRLGGLLSSSQNLAVNKVLCLDFTSQFIIVGR